MPSFDAWLLALSALSFNDIMVLPQTTVKNDIHCVTGWSKSDNHRGGVFTKGVVKEAQVRLEAKFVMLHAEEGWTTHLPIEDFLVDTSLLAHSHDGEPLTPKHGVPGGSGGIK